MPSESFSQTTHWLPFPKGALYGDCRKAWRFRALRGCLWDGRRANSPTYFTTILLSSSYSIFRDNPGQVSFALALFSRSSKNVTGAQPLISSPAFSTLSRVCGSGRNACPPRSRPLGCRLLVPWRSLSSALDLPSRYGSSIHRLYVHPALFVGTWLKFSLMREMSIGPFPVEGEWFHHLFPAVERLDSSFALPVLACRAPLLVWLD
mgnify:FL=1